MKNLKAETISKFFSTKLSEIDLDKRLIDSTVSSLIEASLFGIDSHGVNLFGHYLDCLKEGRINKGTDVLFKIKGACISCNAKNNLANYAAKKVIHKLNDVSTIHGIAIASIKNCDHIGAVGIHGFNTQIKNKLIFGFTNADALSVTPDGKSVIFGTNPISLIFRSKENFLYIDLATTNFSMNKVKNHRRANADLPENIARDKDLRKTINPHNASFLEPIGAHKGFALAYLVEILTSGLSGQNHSYNLLPMYGTDLELKRGVSHTFIMIDPTFFDKSTIESINDKIFITNEKVTENQSRLLPGNKEKNTKKERLKKGIPVPESIYSNWQKLGLKDD